MHDPPGTELGTDITINKGEVLDIAATVHIDGGNPQWYQIYTLLCIQL